MLGFLGSDRYASANGDVYNFCHKVLELLGAVRERRAYSQGRRNAYSHFTQYSLLQSLSPAPNR